MGESVKDEKFRGRYSLSIDSKGRVNVPAPFRDVLVEKYGESSLFLATIFDHCLRAYPTEEWEKIEEHADTLSSTDESVKFYYRHFISSAVKLDWDKQGRILLPASHKEWAGINNGQVLFLGLTKKFEIWDKAVYESKMVALNASSVEDAISDLGGQI